MHDYHQRFQVGTSTSYIDGFDCGLEALVEAKRESKGRDVLVYERTAAGAKLRHVVRDGRLAQGGDR